MQIYNKPVVSSYYSGNSCIYPVSLTSCLPNCFVNQYLASTCTNCSTNCLYSCGFSNSCNLCKDILCSVCYNYTYCNFCTTNATINTSSQLCQCDSGYTNVTDQCLACHMSCSTCSSTNYTNCVSCASNYLSFPEYSRCLPGSLCPTNYGNSSVCVYQNSSLILSAVFNKLSDVTYDTVFAIPIQSGNDSSFYPNYNCYDVIAGFDRGFYYNPTSFLNIGNSTTKNLIFGPVFTISI